MNKSDLWIVETRKQAVAAGRKKYWTGKKCSRGHEYQRYTASGICCKCNSDNSIAHQKRFINTMRGMPATVRVNMRVREDQAQALKDYCNILNQTGG